ncbi:MAG: Acyltransferase domain protein [Acidobacteria bacterium]|jgi:1-acyl-sn-glycerol-3-phosphate acyltransferase|nr:Acyltransferase domain protein [Acidobacteriota bacterium]
MKNIRAALRYALFVISTLGLYSFWFIVNFFISNKQLWRQIIFHKWAQSFVKISRMKIEVIGKVPQKPFFLVSNHLSYTDVPALRAVVEGVFVAKGEIEGWFLAGKIVRDMGTIFINRQNRRDIPRAGSEIIKRLGEGEGVIVFPEGTSTKGEEILPFNSSFLEFAAQTDLPVSYASITYKTPDGGPTASEAVCWWDEKTFGEHLWYLFQLKEYTAVINFGDQPIHNENRKALAKELRDKIKDGFIPVI